MQIAQHFFCKTISNDQNVQCLRFEFHPILERLLDHFKIAQAVHIGCDADFCDATTLALKVMWCKTAHSGETEDLPDGMTNAI